MSRREDIENDVWADSDFAELTPESKLIYLWSFTNPHCNMSGVYKVRRATIAFETTLPDDRLAEALEELEQAGFLFYDGSVLWVRSRVKHLRTRTVQIAKSIAKDIARLDGHPFAERFCDMYGPAAWLTDALAEVRPNVTRGSGDVHGSSDEQRDSLNLTRTSPEPHPRFQGKGKGKGSKGGAGGKATDDAPPDDFPDSLLTALSGVLNVLERVHRAKGGIPPTRRSVGMALAAYPLRDHVANAQALEHWLVAGTGQKRSVRDVVGFYRNWIAKEADMTPPAPGSNGGAASAEDADADRRTAERLAAMDR